MKKKTNSLLGAHRGVTESYRPAAGFSLDLVGIQKDVLPLLAVGAGAMFLAANQRSSGYMVGIAQGEYNVTTKRDTKEVERVQLKGAAAKGYSHWVAFVTEGIEKGEYIHDAPELDRATVNKYADELLKDDLLFPVLPEQKGIRRAMVKSMKQLAVVIGEIARRGLVLQLKDRVINPGRLMLEELESFIELLAVSIAANVSEENLTSVLSHYDKLTDAFLSEVNGIAVTTWTELMAPFKGQPGCEWTAAVAETSEGGKHHILGGAVATHYLVSMEYGELEKRMNDVRKELDKCRLPTTEIMGCESVIKEIADNWPQLEKVLGKILEEYRSGTMGPATLSELRQFMPQSLIDKIVELAMSRTETAGPATA